MPEEIKPDETLADVVLEADGRDLPKLLMRVALHLDRRLDSGSDFMKEMKTEIADIKAMVKELPCKIPVPLECNAGKSAGFIGGVLATISFIGVGAFILFDALRPYWDKIIKFGTILKGGN